MLQYGCTLELTEKDALEIEKAQNSSQQIDELTKDVHRLSVKTKRTLPRKMPSKQTTTKNTSTCFKGGGQWPHPDCKCPTYQRQCRKCEGFTWCCKSRQAKRPPSCYEQQQERCPLHGPKGGEDEQLQTRDRSKDKTKIERQCSYSEQPH